MEMVSDRDSALEYLSRRTRSLERRTRIRPMTSLEIVDTAFQFYRSMGWSLVRHLLVPCILIYGVLRFVGYYLVPALTTTSFPDDPAAQAVELFLVFLTAIGIGVPLMMLALSAISGIVTTASSDYLCGNKLDDRAAARAGTEAIGLMVWPLATAFFWSLLPLLLSFGLMLVSAVLEGEGRGVDISTGLAAVLGVMGVASSFLIGPMILCRFALVPSVVVIEGLKGRKAVRRAVKLLNEKVPFFSPFGVLISGVLLLAVMGLIVGFGFDAAWGFIGVENWVQSFFGTGWASSLLVTLLNAVPFVLAAVFVAPVWCALTTFLYYNQRSRLEGYDIEMLAEDAARANPRLLA